MQQAVKAGHPYQPPPWHPVKQPIPPPSGVAPSLTCVDLVRLAVHESHQVIPLTTIRRELHQGPNRTRLVPHHPRLQRLVVDTMDGVRNTQRWLAHERLYVLLLLLLHRRVARPAVEAVRCCWHHGPLRASPGLHCCWHLLLQQLLLCLPLLLKQHSCHAAWGSTADSSKPTRRTLQRLLVLRIRGAWRSSRHSHALLLWQRHICPLNIISRACAGAGALPLDWLLLLLVPRGADGICVHR